MLGYRCHQLKDKTVKNGHLYKTRHVALAGNRTFGTHHGHAKNKAFSKREEINDIEQSRSNEKHLISVHSRESNNTFDAERKKDYTKWLEYFLPAFSHEADYGNLLTQALSGIITESVLTTDTRRNGSSQGDAQLREHACTRSSAMSGRVFKGGIGDPRRNYNA